MGAPMSKNNGIITCNCCGKEFKHDDNVPHDYLAIGWRQDDKGIVMNKSYDVCPSCMKKLYKILV